MKAKDEAAVLAQVSKAITGIEKGLKKPLIALLTRVMVDSGEATADQLVGLRTAAQNLRVGVDEIAFEFDVTNKRAVDWVRAHVGELIDNISETTRTEIRDLVEEAFEAQYDVDDLAAEIEAILGDDARADKIARTETMRASNEGLLETWAQAEEAGILTGTEQKEWITTPDDRLCPVCEPLDGVNVALDGTFSVDGAEIDAPPAHPNCRCTMGLSA